MLVLSFSFQTAYWSKVAILHWPLTYMWVHKTSWLPHAPNGSALLAQTMVKPHPERYDQCLTHAGHGHLPEWETASAKVRTDEEQC